MKAVVARAFGSPEEFSLESLPDPQPGAGELRIAVCAAGVGFVDALIAAGRYQLKPTLPFTPGGEYAGVIDAIGPGVRDWSIGERVCAAGLTGAFAEKVVQPADACYRIPARMGFEVAAVFRVSYATAYYALMARGGLAAGETVLVLGAGGAVGQAAIQIARAFGATVIGSASSESRRALAIASGASHAIDSSAPDWRDQVKRLTEGRGVDIVVDPVGGSATERAFRSLAWRGRHLVIGFAGGSIPSLPTNLALLKGASLVGVDIRQFRIYEPDRSRADLEAVFELWSKAALKPAIAKTLPLERFAEAMRTVAGGEIAGRVVLRVGD